MPKATYVFDAPILSWDQYHVEADSEIEARAKLRETICDYPPLSVEGGGTPDGELAFELIEVWYDDEDMEDEQFQPPDDWDDHPEFTPADWKDAVAHGRTREGYRSWVNSRIAEVLDAQIDEYLKSEEGA